VRAVQFGSAGVSTAGVEDNIVSVALTDDRELTLHALALRDLCPCPDCRHPVSGQRLFESAHVLPTASARCVSISNTGSLVIDWADGHRSAFSATALSAAIAPAATAPEPLLWGAELGRALPWHEWTVVSAKADELAAWLRAAALLGFSLLRGVPCEDGMVAQVAERFGAVRETNYGRVFDVRVTVGPTNLADTSLALSPHTDNPYRRPTPTLQLLHCLATDVRGGETVLVDGFAVLERLAARGRAQLELLTRTPIRYSYRDASADLAADVPVVTLGPDGRPAALHLNNRSKGAPSGSTTEVAAWYDAYLALLALIDEHASQITFQLEPGDLVLFDNERVLHGRTRFAGGGVRHLQGCYADRDGLLSTLAVLAR
jgi:gamma-butyrobetaine dioxygenase